MLRRVTACVRAWNISVGLNATALSSMSNDASAATAVMRSGSVLAASASSSCAGSGVANRRFTRRGAFRTFGLVAAVAAAGASVAEALPGLSGSSVGSDSMTYRSSTLWSVHLGARSRRGGSGAGGAAAGAASASPEASARVRGVAGGAAQREKRLVRALVVRLDRRELDAHLQRGCSASSPCDAPRAFGVKATVICVEVPGGRWPTRG